MEQLDDLKVTGPVEDLLALAAADDEAGIAQGAEMVRDCGTGHFQHGGDVDDTFFTVAEHPENAETGRITELIKQFGDDSEFPGAVERLLQKQAVTMVGMAVGQDGVWHGKDLLWSVWQHFSPDRQRVGENT